MIGAIALAERQQRRAKFEDVYSLLLPMKEDFRGAVAEACADQPDLDQTAEFFRSELPDDLRMAGSAVAQRLDAPRNKVAGLTGVPPLRRFFNHPTDISLREILEARDVLIVDANMGAIGEDNSKACMHFLLRMLHSQMQRQVHLPETDRPRVPLLVDEAHYVAGAENVVDQIATHRRAGLETSFGLQYFAQLGSGSQHEEKIRKGVLNLLQSRFLFRMGDAQDAEEATRIAMAVYSTMIRDDPDSRARLRVTPEQALNFPNHHCLASWIAMGSRIPSFMGQTYAFPPHSNAWAEHHLADLAARVAPYPDDLESTLDRAALRAAGDHDDRDAPPSANGKGDKRRGRVARGSAASASVGPAAPRRAERSPNGRSAPAPATNPSPSTDDEPIEPSGPAVSGSGKHEVQVDYEAPPAAPNVADSPVRRLVGRQTPGAPRRARGRRSGARQPARARRSWTVSTRSAPPTAARRRRQAAADVRRGLLDPRAARPGGPGAPVADRPRRAPGRGSQRSHQPTDQALPPRPDRPAHHRNPRALAHRRQDRRCCTRSPAAASRSPRRASPAPAISPKREWRPIEQRRAARLPHDLHALGWAIELHRTVGPLATDRWRTPRYATGRYPVPQVGSGQRRHPITLNEIAVPDGQAIIDVELKTFSEVKPDLSLELRIDALKLTFDLLVELDLTARPSYNRDKLLAYDAFLCGWSLAHPRYRTQGTRPAVVFVCPDAHAALACAREADEALTGRIGVMGTPAEHWYFAGRDHLFFAVGVRHPPRRPLRPWPSHSSRPASANDLPARETSS